MASSRKTWISILIAAAIVVAVLAAAIIGSTAFFFYRHISTESTNSESAAGEFARARQRFAGQQALIELRGESEAPTIHRRASAGGELPQTLRVLAFEPRDRKLVRINIPFWLLRLAPSRPLTLRDGVGISLEDDRLHLTVQDLDRAGPGLILDARDLHGGTQALVWTE